MPKTMWELLLKWVIYISKFFLRTYFHDVTLWKLKSELIVEKQILAVFIVLKNDAKL